MDSMELTPEDELSQAAKAVLQLFRLGRDADLTEQDRRSLGAALRQFAWESRCELQYLGPGGGWMYERMHEMAELIGGEASEEEDQLRNQIIRNWKATGDGSDLPQDEP